MRTVEIEPDKVAEAAARIPAGQPVIMINLLRYRSEANYATRKDQAPCSGREAYYQRYAATVAPLIREVGGKAFWLGAVMATVIGPANERWDEALLMEYPNFAALQALFDHPAYQAAVFHRSAALEDSRLIATATTSAVG